MTNSMWEKTATALLLKHSESLYAYVLACVRNHSDADDVLQNVAMAVIESQDGPADEGRFLAWAREIARRRVLEHFRLRKRNTELESRLVMRLAEAAERVERKSSTGMYRDALLGCLDRLSDENRQLLIRRYSQQHGQLAELARQYGKTEQALHAILYRLRDKLRMCVEQQIAAEGD